MAATSNTAAGITTVTHQVKGTTAKILNGYGNAAEALWKRSAGTPEDFSALTNQQKLNLVHTGFMQWLLDLAKSNLLEEGKESGEATALTEYTINVEVVDVQCQIMIELINDNH